MGKDNRTDDEVERIVVRPHPGDPLGVRADVITDRRPVHVDWGDGSKRDKIRRPGRKPGGHEYAEPGSYRITAIDDDGNVLAAQQVVVRAHVELQGIDVDDEDGAVRLAFGDAVDDGTGVLPYYRIEWPDGDIECVWGVPGRMVRHEVIPGSHHVRVVDTTTGRVSWFDVHVADEKPADPDFTVAPSREDESGMTVVLRLTAVQDHPVHIWWDDADGPQVVERPQPDMEIPHRYTHPGHYLQTVAYAGELSFATTKAEAMTVPTKQLNNGGTDGQDSTGAQPAGVPAGANHDPVGGAGGDAARPAASGVSPVGDLDGDAPVGQFPPEPAGGGDAQGDDEASAAAEHADGDGGRADGVDGDTAGEAEERPVVQHG